MKYQDWFDKNNPLNVAPARERGLKCLRKRLARMGENRRSREGAWIEIDETLELMMLPRCRSREGAWIEIPTTSHAMYAGSSRSREGAWIEIPN